MHLVVQLPPAQRASRQGAAVCAGRRQTHCLQLPTTLGTTNHHTGTTHQRVRACFCMVEWLTAALGGRRFLTRTQALCACGERGACSCAFFLLQHTHCCFSSHTYCSTGSHLAPLSTLIYMLWVLTALPDVQALGRPSWHCHRWLGRGFHPSRLFLSDLSCITCCGTVVGYVREGVEC